MGSISFLLPDPLPPDAQAIFANACFAAGYDMAPMPTGLAFQDNRLIVSRSLSESGYLMIPWPAGRFGILVSATSTLRESDEPYRLLIELARGKLNQVRSQAAEWAGIGLRLPQGYEELLNDTTRLFARALLQPPSTEADTIASHVLERSFGLGDTLVREFSAQMFDTRHHDEGLIDTRLAARSTGGPGLLAEVYARSFNAAQVAFCWRNLEPEESHYDWTEPDRAIAAAKAADIPITGGPVIDLAPGMLPSWANGWEGDLPTLAAFMCDFLETVIGRYKGDIQRWVVCGGFNQADALGLEDDDRLRLAFRLFEAAAQIDPNLELILNVAHPWGDYLVNESQTISPLTFTDDMIRAGLKVSAVELEIRDGIVPRGSLPRDLLDTSRLLNLFGLLGVPIEVVLSHPSSDQVDPQAAIHEQSVWLPSSRNGLSLEGQAEWGAACAALSLCSPNVRAVTWDHWSDAEPHFTPTAGLIDGNGQAKPLLSRLSSLRSAHLR